MHTRFFLILLLLGCFSSIKSAFSHGGLSGDEDVGNALFWVYGILLAGIIGTIIYRKWFAKDETPERRELKRCLSEFEHSLNSCLVQLQNADDYPNECGLNKEQRSEKKETVALIQKKIDDISLKLTKT